jgi:hypothetical protein
VLTILTPLIVTAKACLGKGLANPCLLIRWSRSPLTVAMCFEAVAFLRRELKMPLPDQTDRLDIAYLFEAYFSNTTKSDAVSAPPLQAALCLSRKVAPA